MSGKNTFVWAMLAAALVILSPGENATGKEVSVQFWTTEVEQDRMQTQNALAREFEKLHPGILVKIVPVTEDRLNEKITSAKAAGLLPDVMRLGLEYVRGYMEDGLLDASAATGVVEDLGKETFYRGPLELVRSPSGGYAAVPIDGWAQGIWYRKDWFARRGLAEPNSWENIERAAAAFYSPKEFQYGIVVGTDPGQPYTQQTFEHIALSNGARLFDDKGNLSIDDERMREVFAFYKKLADYGPPGHNFWRQARQNYLTGRAAMIFYSPYIIDDIAGLVEDQDVAVEELPKKTGFVATITGLHADKASYGQVVSLGILKGADTKASQEWVKFLLTDGYARWCFMTPGGKTPVRKAISDDWQKHEIFSYYGEGMAERLSSGMDEMKRWGYVGSNWFPLMKDVYGMKVVPEVVGSLVRGKVTPEEAAAALRQRIEGLRD